MLLYKRKAKGGSSRGIGTFQFNDQTVAELTRLLAQSKRGQQVNSVFGEGVNPRLRKIQDRLDASGLSSYDLLNHGAPRLVYGVELIENCRDYLLGRQRQARFILPLRHSGEATKGIARWWAVRWLLPRLENVDVLERVARHNFIHPIRHGARLVLPPMEL